MSEIRHIELDKIKTNAFQPQLDHYDEAIIGLAETIRKKGMLKPITVREADGYYEIIAGENKARACKYNGDTTIEAIVLDKEDEKNAELAIAESLQKEELNVIEQALAMQYLMEKDDLTQTQLAKRLNYRQSTVANKLRLLKLPDYIKSAIVRGVITERHARALLKVEEDKLEEVFLTIVNRHYNVAKTEEYIKALSNKQHHKGVSNNIQIGINTIKQAYDLCRKSGIDADYRVVEYADSIKITIKMKK